MIYPALASRLGLLKPDLVLGITRFYSNCEEARRGFLELITERTGIRYASTIVLRPAVDGVRDVQPTLRAMESMIGAPEAERPKLGLGPDIIEMYDAPPPPD